MSTFTRYSFEQGIAGGAATGPDGYTVTHIFQGQDDDGHNIDRYREVVLVDDWDQLPSAIESLMTFCHGAGFTVSLEIVARSEHAATA